MFREIREWFEELACRAGLDGLPFGGRGAVWVAGVVAIGIAGVLWWTGALPGAGAGTPQAPDEPGVGASSRPVARAAAAEVTTGVGPAVAATVTVHVVGEVRRPGVYELPGGARGSDAVAAAGGLLGAADQSAVNLARVVADGEQIAVPREGESGPVGAAAGAAPGAGASGAAAPGGKVDLNSATEAQLDTLPGVGPSTASKIVADRTANGPFKTVDDLMRVPGIGPAKLDSLRDLVTAG